MSDLKTDATLSLRRSVYYVLIALAAGNMAGRIMAVNSVDRMALETYRIKQRLADSKQQYVDEGLEGAALDERLAERRIELESKLALQRPFLSSNDRSRWLTIRALVEHGTYAIDDIVAGSDPESNWDSIDMVQHPDREGVRRLYSSKPPLLPTLLAGPYWVIHKLSGATLGTHPYEIGRSMLILINVIPAIVMLVLLSRIVDRLGTSDWGRIFVMAAAVLGTFLTTFAVVLNNHLIAAVCVTIALYAVVRICFDDARSPTLFAAAGFFSAFAAANELPALAFLGLIGAALLWHSARPTLFAFTPAALIVVVAFFATNYIAHDSLRPPYAHWSKTDPDDNWYEFTFERGGRTIESYWSKPSGIDRGEASRARYALHVLVGHHGIFSLTPIWLLTIVGIFCWAFGPDRRLRALAAAIAGLSLIVLAFYLMRPELQRNYGGMTSGLRWMFWFTPLWLIAMLPAVDRMAGSRPARMAALCLLTLSVLSASFPTWNPWTHPWIARWMMHNGWLEF